MSIRVGKGKTAVKISGPMADGLEKEIRKLMGPILVEMEREGDAILANARKKWPVKSGKSRDSWTKTIQLQPGELVVEVALVSDVPYTRYIESTKVGKKDNATRINRPLNTLIKKPVREAKKRLKKTLPAIIGAALQPMLGD